MAARPVLLLLALGACSPGDAPEDSNSHTDGGPDEPVPHTDTFPGAPIAGPDLLFVIDDSCSMVEEQHALATHAGDLLTALATWGDDWHIGVITTDTSSMERNGRLLAVDGTRFLHDGLPSPATLFAQMVQPGSDGSFAENGLLAISRALAPTSDDVRTANAGFLRGDASLHVVVVSDEDDHSAPQLTRTEFATVFRDLKPMGVAATFSAIVGPLPAGCTSTNGPALAGAAYLSVARALDGLQLSVCDRDWGAMLTQVGLHAMPAQSPYVLSRVPDVDTLEVTVESAGNRFDGVDLGRLGDGGTLARACLDEGFTSCFGFRYDATGNAVTFDAFAARPESTVSIRYMPAGA